MARKALAFFLFFVWLSAPGGVRADFIYGGDAYGAAGPPLVPNQADTGPLPSGGGMLSAHQDSFTFMGVVMSGALDAKTMGIAGVASSDASVAAFQADLRLIGIPFMASADLIQSHTKADGNVNPFALTGSAMFTNFMVNNVLINTEVPANTMIDLSTAGSMVLNEETTTDGQIIVNAVHVHLNVGVDIFLAHTESDISSQQGAVPEPGTLLLLGAGCLGLAGLRRLAGRFRAQR